MSGKMCSSNSVVQAQKLVDQLRVEAGMERIKVCKNLNTLLTTCMVASHHRIPDLHHLRSVVISIVHNVWSILTSSVSLLLTSKCPMSNSFLHYYYQYYNVWNAIRSTFIPADLPDSSRLGPVLSGPQAQWPPAHRHRCLVQSFQR